MEVKKIYLIHKNLKSNYNLLQIVQHTVNC
jgi:hypothetical protein